jgi:radical SAM superfamily enzyme YgiQ (UPF0313 family)
MTNPSDNSRRRKLRLINPRSPFSTITIPGVIRRMTFSRKALFAPLNLTVCAAVAPARWDVEIIDENTTDAPHEPSAEGIDAVGMGVMTGQTARAHALADAYRALGVPVILGGLHTSALPDEALRHASIVCRGDAEATLPHALNDLDDTLAKREQNNARGLQSVGWSDRKSLEGLESFEKNLPRRVYHWMDFPVAGIATPRKDLLDPKDYLVFNPIQTTRGCPHGCTFCTTPAVFGRRFRQRPIDDIVEEIRLAKQRFNTGVFIFSDDNVAGHQRWAMELFEALRPLRIRWASQCDILIARNDKLLAAMRDSGCIGLILGLESPRAGTLREAGKKFISADVYVDRIRKIRSYGISLWGSFIFGFDSDDWRDCMRTVRFAQRADLCMSCYIILTPYPGTAIFEQYRAEGRLLTTDWQRYDGSTVCFQPKRMTVAQLRHVQMAAFREFFALPSAVKRLGVWPFASFKKHSWLANLAIQRGLSYYYSRRGRPLPRFSDFLAPDGEARIARSLGLTRRPLPPL